MGIPFVKKQGGKDGGYSRHMADAIFKISTPRMLSGIVDAMDKMYEPIKKNPDDHKGDRA